MDVIVWSARAEGSSSRQLPEEIRLEFPETKSTDHDRRRTRVDPPLGFGRRYPDDTVNTTFPPEASIRPIPFDLHAHVRISTLGSIPRIATHTFTNDRNLPAFFFAISGVHVL